MTNNKNRISRKTICLCAAMLMVSMPVSGQDTTANTMQEVIKMVERLTSFGEDYSMNEVEQMIYDHRHGWYATEQEPDWEKVKVKFSGKYPEMNVDSLAHRARFLYFHFLANTFGREKDKENRVKALAYLANTYGERWAPGDLTSYARDVIRFDFGHDQDALRWTKMALEMIKKEPQIQTMVSGGAYIEGKRYTLSRILAKMGRKEEALNCIADALPFYPVDDFYLNQLDGTYRRGMYIKMAMSDLFEIVADRGRWLDNGQKRALYKGKVDFEEDKRHWRQVRDNYLVKEFSQREADSLMYVGAMNYYEVYLADTLAWTKPFVEYAEAYGNIDARHKNNHAWELFKKSDQTEVLKKALKWSRETLKKDDDPYLYAYLSTNASLKYKLGDQVGALKTYNKAISLAPDDQKAALEEIREKMKKGEKTW